MNEAPLAGQAATNVSALKVEGGYLTGRFDGDIQTPDANKRKYYLRFSLKMKGGHCQVNWLPRDQATISSIQAWFHYPYLGAVSGCRALT